MRVGFVRKLSCLFLVVLALGFLTGPSFSVAQDNIKIGFVADISGVGATFYKGQKAAIDLFIEELNASGGLLGRKMELFVRDAQL